MTGVDNATLYGSGSGAKVWTGTLCWGDPMLDAYIIDRIRREREQSRKGAQVPLHIEVPRPPPPPENREREEDRGDRGSTVIDFLV